MHDRRPLLLTVSGSIPPDLDAQVAAGRRPRADYQAIAAEAGGDVVDVGRALAESGWIGRVVHRAAGGAGLLAWYAFRRRRRYEVVMTDGEHVGLPYAVLTRLLGGRRTAHVMIVHVLSVPKKERLIRVARLAGQIDRYVTYCSAQSSFVRDRLRVPGERVVQSTFMVDTEFFAPLGDGRDRRRLVCSAGLERRDYPTLMEAVESVDVSVVIAAASPWSKQPDSSSRREPPDNVEIRRLSLFDLRQLYAESAVCVMPLVEVDFQAGITTILEAMAMALPVVCTRTPGQTDTIIDGETGVYVPSGDPDALRRAITRLLDDRAEAERLGRNARRWVVEHADIELYARRLGDVIDEVRGQRRGGPARRVVTRRE